MQTFGCTGSRSMITFNHMVKRLENSLDRTYGALAHPTRREILASLRTGPMRVTDAAAPFDVSLAAVSKHIAVLESAGVVARSVEGRDHLLSLEPVNLLEAGRWIDGYREFWEGRLDALDSLLQERR